MVAFRKQESGVLCTTIKFKIIFRIVITNILYYFPYPFFITRQCAFLHFCTKKIAQYAAEVFMPRIRKEASRICCHTDKRTYQTHSRECSQLFFNPVFLVKKPP